MSSSQHYYYFIDRPYLPKSHKYKSVNKAKSLLARGLLLIGLAMIGWVGYPLISWQLVESARLAKNRFVTPGGNSLPSSIAKAANNDYVDYTQAANWFPAAGGDTNLTSTDFYSLSIPKLKIKEAKVALSGENLSESLVHYGGTALPGNLGNGVVFGHSILPQFYNPGNYMAIFSTLHTLDDGDPILIDSDGVTYQYQVVDMFEVSPDEISVLDQEYDDQHLTLITCTPPGTYLRRLIVKAKLVPYEGVI